VQREGARVNKKSDHDAAQAGMLSEIFDTKRDVGRPAHAKDSYQRQRKRKSSKGGPKDPLGADRQRRKRQLDQDITLAIAWLENAADIMTQYYLYPDMRSLDPDMHIRSFDQMFQFVGDLVETLLRVRKRTCPHCSRLAIAGIRFTEAMARAEARLREASVTKIV
jgi:hypothetical protein